VVTDARNHTGGQHITCESLLIPNSYALMIADASRPDSDGAKAAGAKQLTKRWRTLATDSEVRCELTHRQVDFGCQARLIVCCQIAETGSGVVRRLMSMRYPPAGTQLTIPLSEEWRIGRPDTRSAPARVLLLFAFRPCYSRPPLLPLGRLEFIAS
jgi:hypothetical protein